MKPITIIRRLHIVHVLGKLEPFDSVHIDKSGVTQVMCHHDRRIQRTKIKRSDRSVIIASLRLDDCRPFILFVGAYRETLPHYID